MCPGCNLHVFLDGIGIFLAAAPKDKPAKPEGVLQLPSGGTAA